MATTYTITDEHTDARADRIAGDEVARDVAPWFYFEDGSIMPEIADAVAELGERLARNGRDDYAEALRIAEGLGLRLERHDG